MPLGNTSVHLTIITFQTFTRALTGLYLSLYHSVPLLAFSFSVSPTISFCLLISLCLSVTPSLCPCLLLDPPLYLCGALRSFLMSASSAISCPFYNHKLNFLSESVHAGTQTDTHTCTTEFSFLDNTLVERARVCVCIHTLCRLCVCL